MRVAALIVASVIVTALMAGMTAGPAQAREHGQFDTAQQHEVSSLVYKWDVTVGDLDGDGRDDIAVSSESGRSKALTTRLQDEQGNLGAPTSTPLGDFPIVGEPQLLDIDGDGRAEVLYAGCQHTLVFTRGVDGTYTAMPPIPTGGTVEAVGDVTGDGRSDLVAASCDGDPTLLVVPAVAEGSFGPPQANPTSLDRIDEAVIADVDGDGRNDVVGVAIMGTGNNLSVWRQGADGSLSETQSLRAMEPGERQDTNSLAVGDVTGDGRPDIVSTDRSNFAEARLVVFPQAADGTYGEVVRYQAHDLPQDVEVVDVNADGRLDVVVGHGGNFFRVAVYEQTDRGLDPNYELYAAVMSGPIDIGDLDDDGLPDVAAVAISSGFALLRNAGSGGPPPHHGFTDVNHFPAISQRERLAGWIAQHDLIREDRHRTLELDRPLTRAQMVMFLWKIMDRPQAVRTHRFWDVPPGARYQPALDWAVERRMVTAARDGGFRPDGPVRLPGQINALWRMVGSPGGSPRNAMTNAPRDRWFTPALDWAVARGITGSDDWYGTTLTREAGFVFAFTVADTRGAWRGGRTPRPSTVRF